MATTRSRRGERTPTDRRHVGLTLPRPIKDRMLEAAATLEWSAGDWVLAAAAEHGSRLLPPHGDVAHAGSAQQPLRRRARVEDPSFTALYLTLDERDELDELARASGLNRSAFVTAVSRLALGDPSDEVRAGLAR